MSGDESDAEYYIVTPNQRIYKSQNTLFVCNLNVALNGVPVTFGDETYIKKVPKPKQISNTNTTGMLKHQATFTNLLV